MENYSEQSKRNQPAQQEPSWELYRSFLGLMQASSLSGAARLLGLTQPTLGRHLDALEQSLGLTLFIRTQQGLSPTREAHALLPLAEGMQAISAALLRTASNQRDKIEGTVRITASEVIAVEVLPPILTRLCQEYPGIVIELVPSNRIEDLLQRDADIAIRMTRPTQAALVAKRLGDIELGFYAHNHYLSERGYPKDFSELAQHRLIGFDRETEFVRTVAAQLPMLDRNSFSARTDNDLAHLALLRAGFGIGICQTGIARRDASLERVLPNVSVFTMDTWLAIHEDLRKSPCCAVCFDALASGLTSYINESQELSN